jgi:hypothetical protein
LLDRERAHDRVERDPQPGMIVAVERAVRLLVEPHLGGQREE